ncbi:MAG: peptidoglycan-binding protein [Myxococcota bacterium]
MTVAAAASAVRAPASPSVVRPPLRLGARSPAVARLQQLLVRHGFDPHGVDGSFGPKTLAAVREFQRAKGLVVDGYVGPITWGALEKAPSSRPAPPTGRATSHVPFYSQMNVPNGYASYACGPTSLSMVMAAEGKAPPSVLQVALRAGTQRSSAGTDHPGLVRALRSYGFPGHTGNGWNALARSLAAGHPVVAHVDTTSLRNRPYRYAGGHYVVITGLERDARGRITGVICNDPATSFASKGKGIRYAVSDFERAWGAKSRWFLAAR